LPLSIHAATEVVKTIRADGTGDYTSLAAWEAAENKDLVAADQIAVARIEGSWPNYDGKVVFEGWVTDRNRYIRVYTAPEARHNGKWDEAKYRMRGDFGTIDIRAGYVKIDGLQIMAGTYKDNNQYGIRSTVYNSKGLWVSHCIIRLNPIITSDIATYCQGIYTGNANSDSIRIFNNIIYNFRTLATGETNNSGFNTVAHTAGATYLYNNTIVNCQVGVVGHWSRSTVAINNIVQNCDDGFNSDFAVESNYNISDSSADAPGANSKNSTVVAFVDAANDDFHLASSDAGAKDAGVDLSVDANLPFNADIDGQARAGSWDMGADEYSNPDAAPPQVTAIDSPATGTAWAAGTAATIRYSTSDNVLVIKCSLSVSYDNGSNWSLLGQGSATFFNWAIPANTVPSSQCLIRVTAYDASNNVSTPLSSPPFSIVDATIPTVTITAPAAGASWQSGSSQTISWDHNDNIGVALCSLYYSLDNGSTWSEVSPQVSVAPETYAWMVPAGATTTAKIKVVVRDAAGNSGLATSAAFTIAAPDTSRPTVSVASPTGPTVACGSAQTVTWTCGDNVGVVRCSVFVSYDGTNYSFLSDTNGGNIVAGSKPWSVAQQVTGSARIRVKVCDAANGCADELSAILSVEDQSPPVVTLRAPNGGETWPASSDHAILWTTNDNIAIAACSLYYTLDQSTWVAIAAVTGTDSSFTWHVPSSAIGPCKIKVVTRDAAANSAKDSSDNAFNITRTPFVYSPDSVVVQPGATLNYTFTYDSGGQSGTAGFQMISEPFPLTNLFNMIIGTVPETPIPRVDTIVIRFTFNTYVEDFQLRVIVPAPSAAANQTAPPKALGLDLSGGMGGITFRLALDRCGPYELAVYNISGRREWQTGQAQSAPGTYSLRWAPKRSGVYVAELRNHNRVLRRTATVMR